MNSFVVARRFQSTLLAVFFTLILLAAGCSRPSSPTGAAAKTVAGMPQTPPAEMPRVVGND